MKSFTSIALAIIISTSASIAASTPSTTLSTISEETYLFEVVQHLYRWYLDETDAEKLIGKEEISFWAKELTPPLDKDDNSKFAELLIPQLDMKVTLKKSDYEIEELELVVKNNTFKMINVSRGGIPAKANGYTVITTNYQAIRDYTYRTRNQSQFPNDDLLLQMRKSARKKILNQLTARKKAGLKIKIDPEKQLGKQDLVIHISPLSKVSNEVWMFWEAGRMLIHFTSDIDFDIPELWNNDDLSIRLYDVDEQTVVSLDEVAGSNAYMTRDQVGRTLFNCIVLGRRIELEPMNTK